MSCAEAYKLDISCRICDATAGGNWYSDNIRPCMTPFIGPSDNWSFISFKVHGAVCFEVTCWFVLRQQIEVAQFSTSCFVSVMCFWTRLSIEFDFVANVMLRRVHCTRVYIFFFFWKCVKDCWAGRFSMFVLRFSFTSLSRFSLKFVGFCTHNAYVLDAFQAQASCCGSWQLIVLAFSVLAHELFSPNTLSLCILWNCIWLMQWLWCSSLRCSRRHIHFSWVTCVIPICHRRHFVASVRGETIFGPSTLWVM